MISDFLKRLLGGRAHLDDPETPAADLNAIRADLTAMTLPAVALAFDPEDPVGEDPHSSIGGAPSLASPDDWPMHDGKPMLFLAQINYADMPPIDGYPTSGLLAIFVPDDDLNGCDFPSRDQAGFVTLYTADPSGLTRIPPPAETEFDPYGTSLRATGARLRGSLTAGLPSPTIPAVEEMIKDLSDRQADEICDWLATSPGTAVYYGGHPDFVQYDIRPKGAPETRVLLQQGYTYVPGADRDWQICWGDAGEATFLISPGDLAALQFGRSIYNWDCG